MLSQIGARRLHLRNIMRINKINYPKSISASGNGSGQQQIDEISNGDTSNYGMYFHYSQHGSGVSGSEDYTVTFNRPITIKSFKVWNIVADGQNGIDIFGQGSRSVYVNGGAVWSVGTGGGSYEDTTLRTGVSSIRAYAEGHCNGGDWTAEAQAGFTEIEAFAVV